MQGLERFCPDGGLRPAVLGILNLTPDSFSDGGRHSGTESAVAAGLALTAAGATWIDVGGESTRPGAKPVSVAEELARILPVVGSLTAAGLRVSVDTTKGPVARAALAAGARMINDVTGGGDPELLAAVAEAGVPLILMHHQGTPMTMQVAPQYQAVVAEVITELGQSLVRAEAAGIPREYLAIDPGIGFGKTVAHNLELLRNLGRIRRELDRPLVLGISRKRFLSALTGTAYPAGDALGHVLHGLLASECDLLRVHDVPGTMQALAAGRP